MKIQISINRHLKGRVYCDRIGKLFENFASKDFGYIFIFNIIFKQNKFGENFSWIYKDILPYRKLGFIEKFGNQ